MKKKWVSVLALSMCFCMGATMFAGCKGGKGGGNGGGNGDGNGNGEGNQPLTQTEMAATVMDAAEATKAYTGAWTAVTVEKDMEKEVAGTEESVWTNEETTTMSIDTAAKKMFLKNVEKETEDGETETDEYTEKYFKEGDKYYSLEQSKLEPASYTQYSEAYFTAILANAQADLTDSYYYEAFGTITDIDAMNAAYATIFADSKAAIAAGSTDETSDYYQMTADGSAVISCEEVDGAYVLKMTMSMAMTRDTDTMSYTTETVITAKDGKIVSVLDKSTWVESGSETVDGVTTTYSETEEYEESITLTYAFDDAAYNAITTTLPAEVEQAPDFFSKSVNLVVNGIDMGQDYMYGSTAADALNNLYSRSGLDVKYYKDAACTQEIAAANMTLTEFSALTTVYAKATATEGYAIYTSTYEYAFGADVTDAYKLVFGAMMDSGYSYINSTNAEYGGITLHNDEDENRVITVNGETITFAEGESYKTYPVTAGQTYTVKYISTYAKADLNIFMMM